MGRGGEEGGGAEGVEEYRVEYIDATVGMYLPTWLLRWANGLVHVCMYCMYVCMYVCM